MKRRHSRADAIAFCEQVRRLRPDIVFGADIIAGFPTETEAMFARSLDLVDECGLTHLHVFPFSRAPRHAGGAHAAGAASRCARSARGCCARTARRRCAAISTARSARAAACSTESNDIGRTEQFTPVRLAAPAEPGDNRRSRRSPAMTGGNLLAA